MTERKKINVLDLFAGCGGLTDGFEQAGGFNTLAAVEWEYKLCETLANRLKTKWHYKDARERVLYFDMQRTKELLSGWSDDPKYGAGKGLKKITGNNPVHLVVGGPPCQAYSVAGRIRDKSGMHDDYRNFLFESYIQLVKAYKPDAFIFENVVGILSAKPGGVSITERIAKDFAEAGYDITSNLKNAVFDMSDYGLPQKRKRVVVLGINRKKYKNSRKIVDDFYNETMPGYKVKKKTTVRDTINGMPKFYPLNGEKVVKGKKFSHQPFLSDLADHSPRFHSKRDIQIFSTLAKDVSSGQNIYRSASELRKLYTLMTGKDSSVHKYYVLKWDEPSNTIVAHLYKDGLRHIHPDPDQARSITVREAARLQGFDDDFVFTGSTGDNYKMIGNAVPPSFAAILAKAVYDIISKQ